MKALSQNPQFKMLPPSGKGFIGGQTPSKGSTSRLLGRFLGLKREIRRRFPYRSYGKACIPARLLALFGGS
jgi:hypothetical protein